MTPFERLIRRLRDDHDLHLPDLVLRRTYAGRAQKQRGAWSWSAADDLGTPRVAAYVSVTSLLTSPGIEVSWSDLHGCYELDPSEDASVHARRI